MRSIKRNNSVNAIIRVAIFIIPFFLFSMAASAQDNSSYEKAKNEIRETFGIFPSMFNAYPKHALAGAWENYKQLEGESNISTKNKELIKLAVAAQIPCIYCVFYHRMAAKSFGATDEEIKEAVALGAQTRQWSMVVQGAEIDFEKFKKEMDQMMKYMTEKAKD